MLVRSMRAPPSRDGLRPEKAASTSIPGLKSSGSRVVVRSLIDSDSLENVSPVLDGSSAPTHQTCLCDLPHALLHITAQNNVTVRLWSRYDIRLIILAVSHYILGDLRRSREQYLTSGRETFGIFDAFQMSRSVAGAIVYDLGRRICKRILNT